MSPNNIYCIEIDFVGHMNYPFSTLYLFTLEY